MVLNYIVFINGTALAAYRGTDRAVAWAFFHNPGYRSVIIFSEYA